MQIQEGAIPMTMMERKTVSSMANVRSLTRNEDGRLQVETHDGLVFTVEKTGVVRGNG